MGQRSEVSPRAPSGLWSGPSLSPAPPPPAEAPAAHRGGLGPLSRTGSEAWGGEADVRVGPGFRESRLLRG